MALYLRKRLDNKAEIAVWQITETEEELMAITSVPTDELEEIQLFRQESHRKQKLAVRALINERTSTTMTMANHISKTVRQLSASLTQTNMSLSSFMTTKKSA